jgi:hypothetical protein
MGKTTVRVTMFPDPVEVDEDEIPNLRHQGLLVEDEPKPADSAAPAGAAKPAAARKTTEKEN